MFVTSICRSRAGRNGIDKPSPIHVRYHRLGKGKQNRITIKILKKTGSVVLIFPFASGSSTAGASPTAQRVKNPPAMQETQQTRVRSLGGKILWRRAWQSLQYSCLENPMEEKPCKLQSRGS